MEVETARVIVVSGATGRAIGLASPGALSNVAVGLVTLVLRPFKAGDFIEAGGTASMIKEVGLLGTEFATTDNVLISSIVGGAISNYSHHEPPD